MARIPRVGVLALQGDFECHQRTLAALGVDPVQVRLPVDMESIDALVMPGGESTTMQRLLEATGLLEPVGSFVRNRPVLATCAGLILLGRDSDRLPHPSFGVIDVSVERNAYGRQIDSFTDVVSVPVVGGDFPGVFIRAPRIRRVGAGVEVVARHGDEPVGVRQGSIVGLCFHPELTQDLRLHRWFLSEIAGLEAPALVPAGRGRRSPGSAA